MNVLYIKCHKHTQNLFSLTAIWPPADDVCVLPLLSRTGYCFRLCCIDPPAVWKTLQAPGIGHLALPSRPHVCSNGIYALPESIWQCQCGLWYNIHHTHYASYLQDCSCCYGNCHHGSKPHYGDCHVLYLWWRARDIYSQGVHWKGML